jgi:hypothetical protein
VTTISIENPFLNKHQDKITGVLSCFDRVIFRGYLPLSYSKGLASYLYKNKILYKNLKSYSLQLSERIKEHVRGAVSQAGAPFRHLQKKEPMEAQARALAQEKGITEGIVCGFSQMENCRTYRFLFRAGQPLLLPARRRCLVLYVFLMHPLLGLIHVKLYTWFPLTMQVYCNGHDFLARKLDGLPVRYALHDNAFTWIENQEAAQACADRFAKQNWPKLLDELAQRFNPLMGQELQEQEYYWVMEQAEYATDVLFKDEAALAGLYPRLLEHAQACFGAEDVMKFFGRKLTLNFQGEVQTWIKRRPEGARVVHKLKTNRLKMYNKAGSVLRIETTLNNPREFRVWRKDTKGEMKWQPLCKGVAWLWRWAEISQGCNRRYLEALSVVTDDSVTRRLLERVTQPAKLNGRRRRALQPLSEADQQLFLAALRGEHRLRGFRNRDLQERLYGPEKTREVERRRRCARVTRLIQLLRAHGLVRKIPRTRRYRVTTLGDRFMSAAIKVKEKHFPKEIEPAA